MQTFTLISARPSGCRHGFRCSFDQIQLKHTLIAEYDYKIKMLYASGKANNDLERERIQLLRSISINQVIKLIGDRCSTCDRESMDNLPVYWPQKDEAEMAKAKINACFDVFIGDQKNQSIESIWIVPFWISRRAKKAINFFRKLVKGINVRI